MMERDTVRLFGKRFEFFTTQLLVLGELQKHEVRLQEQERQRLGRNQLGVFAVLYVLLGEHLFTTEDGRETNLNGWPNSRFLAGNQKEEENNETVGLAAEKLSCFR